jgi:hypothetical protein
VVDEQFTKLVSSGGEADLATCQFVEEGRQFPGGEVAVSGVEKTEGVKVGWR